MHTCRDSGLNSKSHSDTPLPVVPALFLLPLASATMNTAGEAASLFGGSPDSSNDPFGSATGIGDSGSAAESHLTGDPFSSQDTSNSAAGLFGSDSGNADLFGGAGASNLNEYGTYDDAPTAYGYSYDAHGSQDSGAGGQYTNQSYADGQAQYASSAVYQQQWSNTGTSHHLQTPVLSSLNEVIVH